MQIQVQIIFIYLSLKKFARKKEANRKTRSATGEGKEEGKKERKKRKKERKKKGDGFDLCVQRVLI
jgi:hypothetical protein